MNLDEIKSLHICRGELNNNPKPIVVTCVEMKLDCCEKQVSLCYHFSLGESLGRLIKLQVWHNNAGSSPAWFLSRVVVHDATARRTYHFPAQHWLAVERGDGRVERELTPIQCTQGQGIGVMQVSL